MFFVRFIPTFPILHRATFVFRECIFVFRECTHALLLNAIAIDSLYLGPQVSVAKGEALWRLAHAAVATSWQSLIAHSRPYDARKGVQLMITALLGQIYGALSNAMRSVQQVRCSVLWVSSGHGNVGCMRVNCTQRRICRHSMRLSTRKNINGAYSQLGRFNNERYWPTMCLTGS